MGDRVLVVEDEETLRRNLVRYLEQRGYAADGFETAEAALESARAKEYAVALLDLRLPGKDGVTLAGELSELSPETALILMTAYASIESAVEALRSGAHDYLLKPILMKDVATKVTRACEHRRLARENASLRRQLADRPPPSALVARSRVMAEMLSTVRLLATSNRTLLLEGESGSGKEVVARMVHETSPRHSGPFVAVSMTAISDLQIESSLFGHEKGAFPGADARREGFFRVASGGTLFLDGIGEMALPNQAKLLRVLETREVIPVGGDRPVPVDARILAASTLDLNELVQKKLFRADLYYRLSALRVKIPPLRLRPDDIAPLAEQFLERHCKEHARPILGFDGAVVRALLAYPWPGNVRELSNAIERATVACAGKIITLADLPPGIAGACAGDGGYQEAMWSFERALIRSTLQRVGGDLREATRALGLSLATLYRRLEKLDLKHDGSDARAPGERAGARHEENRDEG